MKIGAVVRNLALTQSNYYMIKTFNSIGSFGIEPYAFYSELSSTGVSTNFSVMNVYYLSDFYNGVLIANDIESAKIMLDIKTNAKMFLYLWDLEWLRLNTSAILDYNETVSVLRNDNIELIARSSSHAKAIENYCNRKVSCIIDDWNINEIRGLYDRRLKQ
jgi:hypothetical protein